MYYGKRKKFLGEPPYDSGGSSIPPTTGIPPAPRPQQPSALTKPLYQPTQQPSYNPYAPTGGSAVFFGPTGPAQPVQMQPVPQKPVQPQPQRPAAPAYVPPTQATYDPTQQITSSPAYTPAASNMPQYDPAVAAQQAAEKQAQQAAAAAQTTYIQPQYAPAQPAAPRPTSNQRRAQAEQRRKEMEQRRKQNKAAQDAAAKARRDAQTKAQRKQQEEYVKQQQKKFEAQKKADEAYAKQINAQEKENQKRAEEAAKVARKQAEQNAKLQQQQNYQLQQQATAAQAQVEAAAAPSTAYAPYGQQAAPAPVVQPVQQTRPSAVAQPVAQPRGPWYGANTYPEGGTPPVLRSPEAQALANKIYFTNKDIEATKKTWGDGSSEYTVSSGDRLLKEIMRRGAELEKMKSLRGSLTPNQKMLANSVMHSTQKELEKMQGDIIAGYSNATSASYGSDEYQQAVSRLASTWNSKFNEMVERIDLMRQMNNPATAGDAYAQLQYRLTDAERTKFNQALAREAAPQIIKAANKIVSNPSSGFFENLFASAIASPTAQTQGTAAAQVAAQQPRPGEGSDLQTWKDSYVTPEAPINVIPGGWAPDPSQAEKMALETKHTQHYFEAHPTVEAGLPSDYQSLNQQVAQATAERDAYMKQQDAETAAIRQRFMQDQQQATTQYANLDVTQHQKQGEEAALEKFIQSAAQQGMSPKQFNQHYGPGYSDADLQRAEQNYNSSRVQQAEQIVLSAKQQGMSPIQFNQHYGPGFTRAELAQAEQNLSQKTASTDRSYEQHTYEKAVGDAITATSPSATGIFDFVRDTKDIVSSAKMYSSPVSLLDPKNLGPKIFDLNRPGFTTPKVSAVPIDFLMRSSKDILTPYLQDAGRSFIDPTVPTRDYDIQNMQISDAVGAGTKWVGKALVDTPAGDTARSYATNYIFETGPVGNTFGKAAKAVGGRIRDVAQAIPYAPAVGEASYGLLRTLLHPAVTRANAYASAAYDINRVRVAANEAEEAQAAAVRQQHEYERVREANQTMQRGEDSKLARQQKNLQQKISMYEDALTGSDYFVPQQSADHFRRQELRQQLRELLPQLKSRLQEVMQRREEIRAQQVSQAGPGQIFAPEMQARAEAAAIDEANQPYYGAVSF